MWFKVSKNLFKNAGKKIFKAVKSLISVVFFPSFDCINNIIFFRAEYKIPGLYVIDSIVRQSRHQFGPDKDVFAPRFAKNIQLTFFHLYKCSEEEKVSFILRLLTRVVRLMRLVRSFSNH